MIAPQRADRFAPGRALILHLISLGAFGVAAPLLSVLGSDSLPFLAVGADLADLAVVALVITLAPGLALAASAAAGRLLFPRWPAAVALAHVLVAATLGARLTLRWQVPAGGTLVLSGGAVTIGVVVTLLYLRVEPVRYGLSWATLSVPVVPLLFLLSPAATQVTALQGSGEPGGAGARTPVAMLIFDEFPVTTIMGTDGRIEAEHFPNFARLGSGATWYRNASTVADLTNNAMPSLYSGTRPSQSSGRAQVGRDFLTAISTSHRLTIRDFQGYCPVATCVDDRTRLGRFTQLMRDTATVFGHLSLPSALVDDLRPLEAVGARSHSSEGRLGLDELDAGTVVIDHVRPPHRPFNHYRGTRYADDDVNAGIDGDSWLPNEALVRHHYQRHQIEALTADAILGDFIDALEASGAWDDALVVVTADHGSTFHPGSTYRDASRTADVLNVAHVPLFVKYPGQAAGAVIDDPVELIDIAPTVLGELDAAALERADGHELPRQPGDGPSGRERVPVPRGGGAIRIETDVSDLRAAARRKFAFTDLTEGPSFENRFFGPGPGAPVGSIETRSGRTGLLTAAGVERDLPHVIHQPVPLDDGWWNVVLDGTVVATAEVAGGTIYGVVSPQQRAYDAAELTLVASDAA